MGELISDAAWAFNFRRIEPTPDTPRRLVVFLHGADGDEAQWAPLAKRLDHATLGVLPRGPRSIAGDRIGWFREGFDEGEPQANLEELQDSLGKLDEFVAQLQSRHAVEPHATWLVGFSQGGELASALAMTRPGCIAGFAMVSGRLVPEVRRSHGSRNDFQHLRALLAHGQDDDVLPVAWMERASSALGSLGVTCEVATLDGGHALGDAMIESVHDWLQRTTA